MVASGADVSMIARAKRMTRQQVREALNFSRTGQRPKRSSAGNTGKADSKNRKPRESYDYEALAPLVASLRDKEELTFPKIAKKPT